MRLKILGLFAVTALLAACAHKAPDQAAVAPSSAGGPPPQSEAALSAAEELKNQVGDRIYFDYDKSDISSEARAILDRQAAFMQKYPNLTFTIEGHCDERGTREYNLALGERRATPAKNALTALGVQSSRLQTIPYGKERPAVVGNNEAAYAQNRRAVTVIN